MSDSRILRSMRMMAWQRAKGELQSMLETYWPEYNSDGTPVEDGFGRVQNKINSFIEDINEEVD